MFPPARVELGAAVAAHIARRRSPLARYVGPLVCRADQLAPLAALVPPGETVEVSATFPPDWPPRLVGAELASTEKVRVVAVEVPLVRGHALADLLEHLDARPPEVAAYVELPISGATPAALAQLRREWARLKLRTGGEQAEHFPTEGELAVALVAAVEAAVPFKLTAGLHNAVRHRDPATGFEHHGFLNVFAAVAEALRGADPDAVAAVLAVDDGGELIDRLADSTAPPSAVRDLFLAIGTCSIEEPIADLASLGLIDAPPAAAA